MDLVLRQVWISVRAVIFGLVILGIAYPAVIWGVGQVAAKDAANGSMLTDNGKTVGSSLLGQTFSGAQWFQSRPSAAGQGYDAESSGGSNLGPNNPTLLSDVNAAKEAIQKANGSSNPPADAVTNSGSGLDPHISPEYARLQVPAVAAANNMNTGDVSALVEQHVNGRQFGFMGNETVNVLELNLALQKAKGSGTP